MGCWTRENTRSNCSNGRRRRTQLLFLIQVLPNNLAFRCFCLFFNKWTFCWPVVGSGKTLIAVLLLRHTILNELDDRANGKTHRVSFFLVFVLLALGRCILTWCKVDSVTLAYQQAAVLRNNIDQNVAHFFGAMGTDLWDKRTWDKHLQRNMVIVCTAEILNQCLLNSYVRMDQINLLIFDEAHHAKKDHPYARFVEHFWSQS